MLRGRCLITAATAAVVVMGATPASASRSVAVDAGPTPSYLLPFDYGVDRRLTITNTGTETLQLAHTVSLVGAGPPTGPDDDLINATPDGWLLAPGQSGTLTFRIGQDYSSWEVGEQHNVQVRVDLASGGQVLYSQTLDNHATLAMEPWAESGPSLVKRNATLRGTVTAGGRPVANAIVSLLQQGSGRSVETDRRGRWRFRARAYKRVFTGAWHEATVIARMPGYGTRSAIVSPRPGRTTIVDLRLSRPKKVGRYELQAEIPTDRLPNSIADGSDDGSIFATAPFHTDAPFTLLTEKAAIRAFSSDGALLWSAPLNGEIYSLDVSPDGAFVVYPKPVAGDRGATGRLVTLRNRQGDQLWAQTIEPMRSMQFSPDASRIALGSEDGTLRVLDRATGAVVWTLELGSQIRDIRWDGDMLYVSSTNARVQARTAATGALVWETDIGGATYSLDVSEHYVLASAKIGYHIHLLRKDSGAVVWRRPVDTRADALLIDPAEQLFGYFNNTSNAVEAMVMDLRGKPLWSSGASSSAADFTADGRYLLVAGAESAAVLDRKGTTLWQTQLPVDEEFRGVKGYAWISDDAKRLVIATSGGVVRFYSGGIGQPPS